MVGDEDRAEPLSLSERMFALYSLLVSGTPTDAGKIPLIRTAPSGLKLLHSASTASEAELLRQTLLEAGFHVEYVPSKSSGIFGTTGSVDVYVKAEETGEALAFLREWERYQGEVPEEEFEA